MELWVLWLVIAGLLLISEIVFQWVWTLCLAIGCLAAMAAALADVSFLVQIVSLSAVSVVAYILLIPVLNRWQEKARRRNRNKSRTPQFAGTDLICDGSHSSQKSVHAGARIDGDCWQVRVPGGNDIIRDGEEVVVTGYDSIILDVERKKTPREV